MARLRADICASVVVDSVWDLLAARRARALGVGLLSGGYGQEELDGVGRHRVYQDPAELAAALGRGWGVAGGDCNPIAEGKSDKSGGSRRHVGELVVRRLSRESEVVTGVSPYIPCM